MAVRCCSEHIATEFGSLAKRARSKTAETVTAVESTGTSASSAGPESQAETAVAEPKAKTAGLYSEWSESKRASFLLHRARMDRDETFCFRFARARLGGA